LLEIDGASGGREMWDALRDGGPRKRDGGGSRPLFGARLCVELDGPALLPGRERFGVGGLLSMVETFGELRKHVVYKCYYDAPFTSAADGTL
jgi:hypothetical protein